MALTFDDTHNMIAYLTKSDASERHKIILVLCFGEEESIDCLPKEEIFTELLRMGMSWNEFSSSMASAVICLSTGRKFIFSKYIFDSLQDDDAADEGAASVAVDDDLPSTSQVQPTTPPSPISQPPSPQQQPQSSQDAEILMDLFYTLLETCTILTRRVEHLEQDKIPQSLEITKLKQRIGEIIANIDADEDVTLKDVAVVAKCVASAEKDAEIEKNADVLSMHDGEVEPSEIQEVVEVVTTAKLVTEVVTAASATITDATTPVTAAAITTAPSAARRRKGVVIRDPKETTTPFIIIHSEPKSKELRKGIMVEEPKPLKKQAQIEQDKAYRKKKEDNTVMRYQSLKRKPQTEAQAKKNMMIYLRNMAGFKMDHFKGMGYDDIRPIFEKKFNSNVAFLEKTREQMEEENSKALKRTSESQAKKVAKKQKLDEEVEELKRHL
uniref:Uncharacterized protein n=1 Tax=Tanacetum cinerariifolium TaxID=118510 RepID=A0A699GQ08_TANCI|nr:hypothetical protein [Tanacetum cinerariifolium]